MSLNRNTYVFFPSVTNSKSEKHISNVEFRRRVQKLMKHLNSSGNEQNLVIPGFQYILGKRMPIWLRIAWLLIFAFCFAICGYQTLDRIQYYYRYPTVVDMAFIKNTTLNLPSFTICNQITDKMMELVNRYGEELSDYTFEPRVNYLRTILNLISEENEYELVPAYLWEAANFSDILLSGIVYSKNRKEIVRKKTSVTAYGECLSFHSDRPVPFYRSKSGVRITFRGSGKLIPTFVTFHQPQEHPNLREILVVKLETRANLPFSLISYRYKNSPINPCISDEEYRKCYRKCLLHIYKEKDFTCKLPFYPEALNIPVCTESVPRQLHDQYVDAVRILLRTDAVTTCNCTRSCEKNFVNWFVEDRSNLKNITDISVYYHEDTITYYTERFDYTIIGLFCDIGGNLGLYTGLSLLSIFELSQNIFLLVKRKNKQKNSLKIPLCKTIYKIMEELKRKKEITSTNESCFKNTFKCSKLISTLILLIIIFSVVYLLYSRLEYYFTYPVAVSIEVLENSTIYFPIFIFCFETRKLLKAKRDFILKKNRDNWCEVDMLDLLEYHTMEHLWTVLTRNKYDLQISVDYGKETFGFPLLDKYKKESVYLPYGNCIYFNVTPQIFSGTITAMTTATYNENECGNTTVKFLLASPDMSDIHYSRQRNLLTSTTNYVFMQVMEHHVYNAPNRPCMQSNEFWNCKKKCLEEKLLNKVNCRLPFIPFDFLVKCKTPQEAKTVTHEYLKLYIETDATKECPCHRQCDTIIYMYNVFPDPEARREDLTAIMVTFQTNLIRKIIEVPAYDIIKLLCEAGGILGVAMGTSVLQMIDVVQVFTTYVCSSANKR